MLRIGTTVMGVDDVPRATRFWAARRSATCPSVTTSTTRSSSSYPPAAVPGAHLALDGSVTPVQERPRIHLDLYAGDTADQEAEIERLVGLGARRADWTDYPPDADFVVLEDTEGNKFCVIDTGWES